MSSIEFWKEQWDSITNMDAVLGTSKVLGEKSASTENVFTGNSITINGKKITISDIRVRHLKIKQKIKTEQYNALTKQEKLILDLPIIMSNLGWLYSAYCQLHWLEASGDTVEVPYEFPVKYTRVNDSINLMKKNIRQAKYASIDEYNHLVRFSLDGNAPYLLYDFDIDSCQKAYYKAVDYLKTINDTNEHTIGNFNFNETPPKLNLIRSYTIGAKFGDLDDLGGSFGRFSLRVYFKGKIKNQSFVHPEWEKYSLNISEIGFRFMDEFSFDGEQSLGYWKYDLVKSEIPDRVWNSIIHNSWIKLSNGDYQRLANRDFGIGRKYMLQTPPHYYTNEILQTKKDIVFFFAI